MTNKLFYILCVLLSCPQDIFALGEQEPIDSLENVISQTTNDSIKCEIFLELFDHKINVSPKVSFVYALQALKIGEERKDTSQIVRAYLKECDFYSLTGEHTSALEKAYAALNMTGNNLALKSACHNHIATVHSDTDNFEETLFHNRKTLQYNIQCKDSNGILIDMHNIGRVFIDLKMYDSALIYLHKTNNFEIKKYGRPDPYSLSNIGDVYSELGMLDSALQYHLKAYYYDCEMENNYLMAFDEMLLGNTYFKLTDYARARAYTLKSVDRLLQLDAYNLLEDTYKILYQISEKEKNYPDAFKYSLLYNDVKDTLRERTKQTLLLGIETKYKVKEQEIKIAADHTAMALLKKHNRLFIILTVVCCLFLISMVVISIMVYRRQIIYKELTEKLKKTNESKEKLISIISHDLRGSVGTLRTAAKTISDGMTDLEDTRGLLESFYPVADTTYDLLENLLTWANCNKDGISPDFNLVDIHEIITKSVEHTRHLAQSKSIQTIINVSNTSIRADRNMILSVARNLLSNAIKFSHSNSVIRVNSSLQNGDIVISVEDNGLGMSPEVLEKVILSPENFHSSGTLGERGSGLGISICKSFLKSHRGKIWAESTQGKGSTFYFSLPVAHK